MIRLLISVRTVRSVATPLREPWWSSMLIRLADGWEKATERCWRFLVSLPGGWGVSFSCCGILRLGCCCAVRWILKFSLCC